MSNISDFVIENRTLTEYNGHDAEAVIPDSVTKISWNAFSGCTTLKSIAIPSSVTKIDWTAFDDCANLEGIDVDANNNAYYSENNAIIRKANKELILGCKNTVISDSVTKIGQKAFSGCTGLISITIPQSVIEIEKNAFLNCTGLKAITMPDSVTSIGNYAFANCTSLVDIYIPDSVVSFGYGIFNNAKIKHLSINGIGLSALGGCEIDTLTIKGEKTNIRKLGVDVSNVSAEYITAVPSELRDAVLLSFIKSDGDFSTKGGKSYLKYLKSNISKKAKVFIKYPELINFICQQKLIKADSIEQYLELAEKQEDISVKSMLMQYNKDNITDVDRRKAEEKQEKALDTVYERAVARAGKKDISGLVFALDVSLRKFDNEKDLKIFIESHGAKLSSVVSSKIDYLITADYEKHSEKNKKADSLGVEKITEKQFISMAGGDFYSENGKLTRYFGDEKDVVIPYGITSIGSFAFSKCRDITNVIVPDSVTKIEIFAFSHCTKLVSVTIPDSVIIIGDNIFLGCKNIVTITCPADSYAEIYAKNRGLKYKII